LARVLKFKVGSILLHLGLTTFAFPALAADVKLDSRLSNLSDGSFERQLDIPSSQNLEPNSALMKKALDAYTKLPFDIGERLKFVITYLGAKGGTAEVLVRTPIKWKDGWAHRFTGEVRSADWYRWAVDLHDSVEGIMDSTPEIGPLRFYINQQEAGFKQSKIIDFDIRSGKIKQRTKHKVRAEKSDEFDLTKETKDALGALYYFRSRLAGTTEPLKTFEFPIFTSEKTWTAVAKYEGREKKNVEGIEYDTDIYRLQTHLGGLLEQKGDIKMWLTHDSRHIPVYTEAYVKFGYIKVSLVEWDQGYADASKKVLYPKIVPKP
jgi:hypothetical protein